MNTKFMHIASMTRGSRRMQKIDKHSNIQVYKDQGIEKNMSVPSSIFYLLLGTVIDLSSKKYIGPYKVKQLSNIHEYIKEFNEEVYKTDMFQLSNKVSYEVASILLHAFDEYTMTKKKGTLYYIYNYDPKELK